MKNYLMIILIIALYSCNNSNNTDKYEGFWLLKKGSKKFLAKIEKVNNDLYILHGGPELGFGVLRNDTILFTGTKSNSSIDQMFYTNDDQLIFDGDTLIKFNSDQANKIINDKLR